ncbi:MAG: 4Fe-4S binding protein [Prevotella sp.]|nr:4Fe-4S binding protein [Prevotella sp.]
MTFDAETRRPRLIGTKCVGCHLCRIVCPTGAIGVTKRTVKRK